MSGYELSVIIPLHNTDPHMFLNCVSSLKNQEIGFENIELIVVLHNCTRETIESVEDIFSPSENVIIAELNNDVHSPSSPRNYGISIATGDYLTFLDADDMFTPECLRLALKYIKDTQADVCHFRKKLILEKEDALYHNEYELWDQTRETIVVEKDTWNQHELFAGAWGMSTGRLYRRQLIVDNDLHFDESIKFAEDYHFVIGVYSKSKRICLAPQLIGYIYYVNSKSLVQTYKMSEELILDYVSGYKKVFDRGIENGLWMNDTIGSLSLIILNWMYACPNLTAEGKRKLQDIMRPYIESLTPVPPSKMYPKGQSDRMNTFLAWHILGEEVHVGTYIKRGDEGPGITILDRQKDAISRVMRNGADSDYGRRYRFAEIETIEEYERSLPIADYDLYKPMIRLTTDMGEWNIFTKNEIIAYALDNTKRIPITYKAIVPYVNALRKSLGCKKTFLMCEAKPFKESRLTMDYRYTNTIFGVMLKEYIKEAKSFGSGYASFTTPANYLFPEESMDMSVKRWVYALLEEDVETVFSPDMDTLCNALKDFEDYREEIIDSVKESDAARAEKLKILFTSEEGLSLKKIWPKLENIVCWNFLDKELPAAVKPWLEGTVFLRGYFMDEYAIYGEIQKDGELISLDMDYTFFEFIPKAQADKNIYTVANILEDNEYKLYVSNLCGLYRYDVDLQVSCIKKEENRLLIGIV